MEACSPKSAATATTEDSSEASDGSSDSGEDREGLRQWLKAQLLPGLVWEEPSFLCIMNNIQNLACGLWVLCVLAFAFFLVGVLPPKNALLSWQSFLLGTAAAGSIFVIGTDPCFLQNLRDSVAMLTYQNKRLVTSNVKLVKQLEELSDVDQKFQTVHKQLDNDVDSALELLRDLEHHSRVQAVVSSLSLFLTADMSKSGSLQPEEAETFLRGFSQLWDLLPDYPQDAVENLEGDITFEVFSDLLRAVIQDDATKCRQILDDICPPRIEEEVVMAMPMMFAKPQAARTRTCTKDLESGSEETTDYSSDDSADSSEDDGVMRPWLRIGPFQIWGLLHLLAILLLVLAALCFCWDLIFLNFFASTISFLLLVLAAGLALQGQLVVVAKRLRHEVHAYKEENDKLSQSVEDLTGQVIHLRSIQKGLENLHSKFGGNAVRAKQLASRESSSSKTHLVSVTLELFARADEDSSGKLEGDELDEFRSTFEEVCTNIPGVNMQSIRHMLSVDGFTLKQVHRLVEDVLHRSPM